MIIVLNSRIIDFILYQIDWLNDYHSAVLEKVGGYLASTGKQHVLKWLQRETEFLG